MRGVGTFFIVGLIFVPFGQANGDDGQEASGWEDDAGGNGTADVNDTAEPEASQSNGSESADTGWPSKEGISVPVYFVNNDCDHGVVRIVTSIRKAAVFVDEDCNVRSTS